MSKLGEQREDECFILVKAQPHRSSNYFETVCCAGVGRNGKWRRQYPVPFRILQRPQQFKRWSWISYKYVRSDKDPRRESQRVLPETISVGEKVAEVERARFLNPLIRGDLNEADQRGDSLTLVRPKSLSFKAKKLPSDQLDSERSEHAALANQMSMFDETAKPLEPCPYEFRVTWSDQAGVKHEHICDDWESAGAFFNFRNRYSEEDALRILREKYEEEYFAKGLAFAFSTHKRRNLHFAKVNQWLLVGLIRLDDNPQNDLFLTNQ
ncbi:MAG: hypothetical protein RKE49_15270 [Oceanicaulis sp.]